MSYFKVMKDIEQGKIDSVYLLSGTETFFIQNIVQKLTEVIIEGDRGNLMTYDLTENQLDEVIQDAETFPFFGEQKLIIAQDALFLQSRPQKLPFEHNLELLENYLHQPSPTTVLVFIAPYEAIDGRKKITKQLKKLARFVPCEPIETKNLHLWILTLAKNEGIQIETEAVEILAANLSTNLHFIQNEIDKCAQYVGEGQTITKDIVLKLLTHLPINTSLELVDTVINRDLVRAMSIYRDLKLMNESPIAMIALLAFQFRILLQVKLLKQKGYNEYQMRQKISTHPYVIKIANQRERRFSLEALKQVIERLTETDAKIKRGQMPEDLAFEQLLYTLIKDI